MNKIYTGQSAVVSCKYLYCNLILYTGKISPSFIFVLFALWPVGEFKTGPIELYIKDCVRKLEGGRI